LLFGSNGLVQILFQPCRQFDVVGLRTFWVVSVHVTAVPRKMIVRNDVVGGEPISRYQPFGGREFFGSKAKEPKRQVFSLCDIFFANGLAIGISGSIREPPFATHFQHFHNLYQRHAKKSEIGCIFFDDRVGWSVQKATIIIFLFYPLKSTIRNVRTNMNKFHQAMSTTAIKTDADRVYELVLLLNEWSQPLASLQDDGDKRDDIHKVLLSFFASGTASSDFCSSVDKFQNMRSAEDIAYYIINLEVAYPEYSILLVSGLKNPAAMLAAAEKIRVTANVDYDD
jgi:hypothetical protein